MMTRQQFAVIGGDQRQAELAMLLANDGHGVTSVFLDASTPQLADVMRADVVILPLPISRDGKHLHTPLYPGADIPLSHVLSPLCKQQQIFGGMPCPAVQNLSETLSLSVIDYYQDETLTIQGAIATAEGAIQLILTKRQAMLCGSHVLVIGYGRIGKLLASRLAIFGTKITVSARKSQDFAWIQSAGYQTIHTNALDPVLRDVDIVVNTVPHLVLAERQLAQLGKHVLCLDLAGSPGGIDLTAAKKLELTTVWAQGLPGKAAPLSMAKCLRDFLYRHLA